MFKKLALISIVSLTLVGCASNQYSQHPVHTYHPSQVHPHTQGQIIYRDGYYQQAPMQQQRQINTTGAIIGAGAGGLIGAQVGKGNGNIAAASIGAATGAIVGFGCQTVNGGQIIGGLAGAILGSQVGKGSGRVAAASIGSATGAVVGNQMAGGC